MFQTTNQFSLLILTNPFESQLMRIISPTFSSLNLSSTGLMASANLAAVRTVVSVCQARV